MSPRVRKLLGYPGQTQRPILADEAEYFLPDDLLAPVRSRGVVYRSLHAEGADQAAAWHRSQPDSESAPSHPREAS
jgi:hypothetical protein